MSNRIAPFGKASVSVAASDKIAVYTKGEANVYKEVGYPNLPTQKTLLQTVSNTEYVSSAFSAAATVEIIAGAEEVLYEVGTAAVAKQRLVNPAQGAPNALNATGTLTVAMILGGIITSTTAAAVTGTLDTGTICDAGADWVIGEAVDWSVINTGGANAFTVAAAAGHTIVGGAVVAASSSGMFRTRKTAANTFITYRLGS